MAETKILGFPPVQLFFGALLIGVVIVVFFISPIGKDAATWIKNNGTMIAAVAVIGVAAWFFLQKSSAVVWASPRETLTMSINDGYLSEFAADDMTTHAVYERNKPRPLRVTRIEPELGYLFIGKIISLGEDDAILLTGTRGAAGKIIKHFDLVPTDKKIEKMREKGLSAYFDAKSLVTETEKAFASEQEEGIL